MVAGIANLIIEQDADFSKTVTWKDSAGTAIPVTGASALLTMKYQIPGGAVTTSFIDTTWRPSGYIGVDGPTGTFTLLIPGSTTKGYTWTNGTYDMQVMKTDYTVTRLIQGGVVVRPSIGNII